MEQIVCIVHESLKVTAFHLSGQTPRAMYDFRGICEHFFIKTCNVSNFAVVGDFLSSNLSMGRLGLQVPEGTTIIDENLNVSSHGSLLVTRERDSNGSVIKVTLGLSSGDVIVERTLSYVKILVKPGQELCGLCGGVDGTLVSSDGVILNDVVNQSKVDAFVNSWKQEPSKQVLRSDRRECGM